MNKLVHIQKSLLEIWHVSRYEVNKLHTEVQHCSQQVQLLKEEFAEMKEEIREILKEIKTVYATATKLMTELDCK